MVPKTSLLESNPIATGKKLVNWITLEESLTKNTTITGTKIAKSNAADSLFLLNAAIAKIIQIDPNIE